MHIENVEAIAAQTDSSGLADKIIDLSSHSCGEMKLQLLAVHIIAVSAWTLLKGNKSAFYSGGGHRYKGGGHSKTNPFSLALALSDSESRPELPGCKWSMAVTRRFGLRTWPTTTTELVFAIFQKVKSHPVTCLFRLILFNPRLALGFGLNVTV